MPNTQVRAAAEGMPATATPMDRMKAASQEYVTAVAEYLAVKGMKPAWYILADDEDFNFGFVCRIEAADA
ncbi:hypothetical protein [Mesorhizobium sp.]|uniref:hypothetical protein n=1 Tax=Mesorhizobium sp. TaxID=1871066 RepID=UPI000FE42AA9|nr:hypothetical protein [Mesorhizobium sp.]RWQ16069.1 MAG: hypothetical protein EOR92_22580 [Mesorhizobium sp.]